MIFNLVKAAKQLFIDKTKTGVAADNVEDAITVLNTDLNGIDISSEITVMLGEVYFLDIHKTGKYIDFTIRVNYVTTTGTFTGFINLNKYTVSNVTVLNAYNNTTKKPIYCMASDTYIGIGEAVSNATITISGRVRIK